MFDTGNNQRTFREPDATTELALDSDLLRLHFSIIEPDDHTVILCHCGDKVGFFTIYTDRQSLRACAYEHLRLFHHQDYKWLTTGAK